MSTQLHPRSNFRQQGAALMVMLVIMVMGATAFLLSSLNSSTIRLSKQDVTATALAQARDALIGYAVLDANRPGELPCPDFNNDGVITIADDYSGSNCKTLIGRLPWRTLKLADVRDGSGEQLWYAVSKPFHASNTAVLNSNSVGDLSISGTPASSNLVAIIFSPGEAISGKSRSPSQTALCTTTNSTIAENLCAANYLEGMNANLNVYATPNTNYEANASSDTFNDRLIAITHDQLFVPVEMRILREAKTCLDSYAAGSSGKYPWAAPANDTTYTGTFNTLFGRISSTPNIDTASGDPAVVTLTIALNALMNALNNYQSSLSLADRLILYNAGLDVIGLKNTIPSLSATIDNAGDWGRDIGNGSITLNASTYNSAVASISNAQAAVAALAAPADPNMSGSWPAGCFNTGTYWSSWQDLLFYQVADGYQPGITTPGCLACLSIAGSGHASAGSGSYRAAVLMARSAVTGQVRNPVDSSTYLEGINKHQASFSTNFETYRPIDSNFSGINDAVLCLDGKNNCK